MKAVTVREAGLAETLRVVDLPHPRPQNNEIVIEQSFAGVNYGDTIRRKRGLFKVNDHGFFIPGFEGVGRIISAGADVKNFKIGDRVSYLNELSGGYSQQICLNEQLAFQIPDNIQDETAAVMTCAGMTAWYLTKLSNIEKDDWVIIHGATGGVGLLLVQLCVLKGANVVGVVGTNDKKDFLEKKYTIKGIAVREEGDITSQIISITNNRKVDAIFDCVGQAVLDVNLSCIRKGGIILYYGSTSGHPSFSGLEILMNSLRIQGFNVFNSLKNTNNWQDNVREFIALLAAKKIDIYIDKIFKITDANKAHEMLENRHSIGKILIDLR